MKNSEKTSIGPWLLWSTMVMVTLSYGYLNSITYECKTMGNNGYLAVLLAAVLTLPGVLIMYLLMKRFPGENLVQQGIGIMGLFCGRVMGFLYLVF
ncbi:MAG TPA: GerAB/ArcD/ProY family transporter, partial [Bacillota bacterium]|nr:GerAB/ArcD/ProY family transporter [Bacillota bacterium]